MKNIILLTIITALLALTACGQKTSDNSGVKPTEPANTVKTATPSAETKSLKENECRICDFDFAKYKGELKKEEVAALLLALNDEYLAFATYEQINKDFNSPRPFINIQQAESRHSERLKMLFTNYKIDIPENPWLGKTAKFASVAEACKAGVDAEIVNRNLYDKLLKSTTREDILMVYRALQQASAERHLPAFQRCGEGGGRGPGMGLGPNRPF